MFLFKTRISKLVISTTLVLVLSGCQFLPEQPVSVETKYISVPRSLYPSCNIPVRDYNTIGERIMWGDSVAESYTICISGVESLVNYLEETRSESQ